jgi:hypothetical protein
MRPQGLFHTSMGIYAQIVTAHGYVTLERQYESATSAGREGHPIWLGFWPARAPLRLQVTTDS